MSEEIFIRYCSPTLAGLKTANLFTCRFENAKEMRQCMRELNGILVKKGIRVIPLRYRDNRALVYTYRPSRLLNKAEGYKCVGEWKVYGDADQARKTFARYRKCTEVYCAQFAQGKSMERLAVAV